jgi:sugar lactone lactonase YvrE
MNTTIPTSSATVVLLLMAALATQAQNLFVSTSPNRIMEITSNGTLSTFASTPARVGGLACDNAGNLFVGINGSIIEITPNGMQSTFASGLTGTLGLTIDRAGNLFALSGSFVYRFTPTGAQSLLAWGLTGFTQSLAVNSAGNVFVTSIGGNPNTGTIVRITGTGMQSTFASGLNAPTGLTFDSTGALFVADLNGNIYEYTPNGTQSIFASGLNAPIGLALNSAGDLFEADANSGTIYELSPNGTRTIFATGFGEPTLPFNLRRFPNLRCRHWSGLAWL